MTDLMLATSFALLLGGFLGLIARFANWSR